MQGKTAAKGMGKMPFSGIRIMSAFPGEYRLADDSEIMDYFRHLVQDLRNTLDAVCGRCAVVSCENNLIFYAVRAARLGFCHRFVMLLVL